MELKNIIELLPEGYKEACWETKAMSRKKGIQDEEILLTLCLFYAYDRSLIDTQNYAKTFLSIRISDVGFMKRFVRCKDWIKWINQHMAKDEHQMYVKPEQLESFRVMAIDASDIVSKGAVKQIWRLHYAVNLFSMNSEIFQITPEETGESLKNFALQPNDLVLADRIYATITGMEHCQKSGADFILRLKSKAFQLYDSDGNKILLSDLLKSTGKTAIDFTVYYRNSDKELKPLRVCAVEKTDTEKEMEQKKIRRKESKKQRKLSEETKFTHNYFFVITSLEETFSAEQILALYRLRWQVEMVFKRFKSILNMGSMPTKTAASSEVWLNCKMLIAMLIEKLLSKVEFSPYQASQEPLAGDEDIVPFDFSLLFRCEAI